MRDKLPAPRVSRIGLFISVVVLVMLVLFTLIHLSEARRFTSLIEHAEPSWVVLALVLQLATYACAGAIWRPVAAAAGFRLRLLQLGRLAIEKLSVDQLIPTGGMSGNLLVARAMRQLGLPGSVATEALMIDILGYYVAYALVTAATFGILWLHHEVARFFLALVVLFGVVLASVPVIAWWLLEHRDWKPGPRLARVSVIRSFLRALEGVSPDRIRDPRLLATATGFHLGIFLLDAGTLWALLQSTGTSLHPPTAFAGLVVGSLAGTISFLPGGLGSFEAGCTASLALLGVPVEAALTGTLFLRGLTLWIPLIPGILLARRDLSHARSNRNEDDGTRQ
ncbi:MAG: lysylphosphatidylglycerol synthase transmembrane domain-containing protein [Polyangiales bacterium]